jgi:phospholipase C
VANQQCSEHPDAPPEDGAQFVHEVIQALAADAGVLDSTVLFVNYDENDGFFDHVPPPVAPAGTADEFIQNGTPIGLGYRVPMIVVSPWTRGGWVDSQTYDHTSVIRFLETWTAVLGTPASCPNISAWRRRICGDLTGAFDFANPVYGLPSTLPATTATISQALCNIELNPSADTNALPSQESGTRPARALPYQPDGYVSSIEYDANGKILLWLKMANEGAIATGAATFAVYANEYRSGGPWQYTVPAYSSSSGDGVVTDFFNIGSGYGNGAYDLTMTGPNRFLRRFQGNATTSGRYAEVTSRYAPSPNLGKQSIWLTMTNSGTAALTFTVTSNHYRTDGPWTYTVAAGSSVSDYWNQVAYCDGWYDFTITVSGDSSWSRRFTGHIESGTASVTG